MRNPLIDFILPTCPGIPDNMWISAGSLMGHVTSFSLKLLSVGFIVQLLFSGLSDSTNGRINVLGYLRLIGKTAGLVFFLLYAKRIFFTWEVFMDDICPYTADIVQQAGFEKKVPVGWPGSFLEFIATLINGIFGLAKYFFFLFTIEGAIIAVNYFKSIKLIFLCVVGPLSAGLTLFPLFSKSFSTWTKSYITVSFQAFTLEIFSILNTSASIREALTDSTLSQFVISLIMFFAVFMTPVWTTLFINSVMSPNLMGAVGQGVQNMVRTLPSMMKFLRK